MLDSLIALMVRQEGVTEQFKAEQPMVWVGRMNSIRSRAEETDIISDQQKLESPGDYPLLSVLMSYYDLRDKERWDWSNGARNKGGINDLKEKASVLSFMKDHNIYSIKDFARLLNAASGKVRELESDKKAKEKRIRDIDAILDAVKTLKELNPIREKYNGIHFTKSKEKYRQEHADEMARIDKANKLLHKLNALPWISVTEAGIVTLSSDEQPENANSPKRVTVAGISIDRSALQLRKA